MAARLRSHWDGWLDLLEANGFVVRALLQSSMADWELAAVESGDQPPPDRQLMAFYRLANGQRRRPSRLAARREGDDWIVPRLFLRHRR
jgi:hypothetical protein